jgi:hypothetical protein
MTRMPWPFLLRRVCHDFGNISCTQQRRMKYSTDKTEQNRKTWSKSLISQGKMAMVICREVIAQLELAQESRLLIQEERLLSKKVKLRLLRLAANEESRARQSSRITFGLGMVMRIQSFSILWQTLERRRIICTLYS